MSTFAIVFYTLMIAASCMAAYYRRRDAFMVLFSLTLISFLMGLLGGEVWLRYIAVAIGLLYACGGLALQLPRVPGADPSPRSRQGHAQRPADRPPSVCSSSSSTSRPPSSPR